MKEADLYRFPFGQDPSTLRPYEGFGATLQPGERYHSQEGSKKPGKRQARLLILSDDSSIGGSLGESRNFRSSRPRKGIRRFR